MNILKFKDKNPNKTDRAPFTEKEINALWMQTDNIYVQIVLMLIYSGVRVSELLDLKRKNVFIRWRESTLHIATTMIPIGCQLWS